MKRRNIILLIGLIGIVIIYYSFSIVSTKKNNDFKFTIAVDPKGDSIITFYDQNDVKLSTCELENGKRRGWQTTFYSNGNKKNIWYIINEQPWAAGEYYSINGDTLFPGTLFFGKGSIYDYFDNGKIKSHGFYKNSLRDSVWTFYHENGQIYIIETYKNGVLTGGEKFK